MQVQAQASPASRSTTGEVDRGAMLDGGAARARRVANEGIGCNATPLKKARAGSPCDREGEQHCFFRSREALKHAE
jgi:hypothetical protein